VLLTREDVEHFYKGGEVLRPDTYSVEIAPVDAPFWRSDVRFRIFKIENPLPQS